VNQPIAREKMIKLDDLNTREDWHRVCKEIGIKILNDAVEASEKETTETFSAAMNVRLRRILSEENPMLILAAAMHLGNTFTTAELNGYIFIKDIYSTDQIRELSEQYRIASERIHQDTANRENKNAN
jgi:2-phosphoglycerate kinase